MVKATVGLVDQATVPRNIPLSRAVIAIVFGILNVSPLIVLPVVVIELPPAVVLSLN